MESQVGFSLLDPVLATCHLRRLDVLAVRGSKNKSDSSLCDLAKPDGRVRVAVSAVI